MTGRSAWTSRDAWTWHSQSARVERLQTSPAQLVDDLPGKRTTVGLYRLPRSIESHVGLDAHRIKARSQLRAIQSGG